MQIGVSRQFLVGDPKPVSPARCLSEKDEIPSKISLGIFHSRLNLNFEVYRNGLRSRDSFCVIRKSSKEGSGVLEPEDSTNTKTWGGVGGRPSDTTSFDFLELKRELDSSEDDVALSEISREEKLESEEKVEEEKVERIAKRRVSGSGRQMLRRSSLLAKQVISMQSACSMGFVSQLWVDTTSWLVVVVEVRRSILSGENEKFLLDDVCQMGDVVLVQDESITEKDVKMIGLDTLVGYNVITSGRRNVGKVRGYTFNINSGTVESLELDSFGLSIIPSSLVSTYSLFVEDVLEVVPDTVVVHDAAISRVQRLTKGFWGTQPVAPPADDIEYIEFRRCGRHGGDGRGRGQRRTKFSKSPSKMREIDDEWDMPVDY